MINREQMIIAGPCAAETRNQILECANALKERGIKIMRAGLWKPRTKFGFDGVGREGLPWFAQATNLGITMGTEILLPEQVTEVLGGISLHKGDPSKVLFWLGSRNQNHFIQREIVKRILEEAPENVRLLIKNQPWSDEEHWLGIVEHVVNAGIELERIILCHRGFSPSGRANPDNFRNLPDFDMAMRVKEATGLPMLLDPSHIGGSVTNVFKAVEMAANFDFNGLMVEVRPAASTAQVDTKQHLTFQELDRLLIINKKIMRVLNN